MAAGAARGRGLVWWPLRALRSMPLARFVLCEQRQVPGISYDGGYAQYMVAPVEALARIPEDLSDVDAAPLLCAGITTFNALRHSGARAGDVAAIDGFGGHGHLAVQYAAKMGFRTVAIARGKDKESLARQLGATTHRQHGR